MKLLGTAVAICLWLGAANAQWITNYYESFSGSRSDLLNGKVPDISLTGAAWQAGNLFYQDGHWDTVVAGTANGQAAWLPITIYDGRIYRVETVFINNNPNWLASGFFSLYPVNNSAILWTDTRWEVRHSNSGYIWALNRNNTAAGASDQQAFVGQGTANGTTINGDHINPTGTIYMLSELNTLQVPWRCSLLITNSLGQSVAWSGTVPDAIRSNTMVAAGTLGIRGVGLSYERSASANPGADVDWFLVTMIPEPSAFALIGLGGLAIMLGLRRRG
ncbi:MAG: PEP-CTERM sorting domain-containing protein [Verrucomicrobiae bacterium]|nr:PEP-CTERM sorting domain-containing protein [Verrucomicrobiae bacterium]